MKTILAVMMSAGMLAISAASTQAAGDRIGVVQLEQLLKAHPDTAPAEAVLEKQREQFEAERRDMLAARDVHKQAFELARDESSNSALSDDVRAEKLKTVEAKYVALREYEREIQDVQMQRQKELMDQGRRLRERIVEKIRGVIKTYAEKEGYTVVVNLENAGQGAFGTVLYRTDKSDITAAVLELVKKEPAR
ncbi:MAG: OmpH family outer membrane protein [Verrucomicrobia bacterium]|nr:OmpH family outer membrane protein [Verrucomicrobiota bacterium]